MEKINYYVSVQANTILENEGEAAYEFVIHATPEEKGKLEELIKEKMATEEITTIRAHIPGMPYHQDAENDEYDESLKRIYSEIFALGDSTAKETISSMGLDRLGTPF